eukprot:1144650-Prorocentrum_minimum.AAC.1
MNLNWMAVGALPGKAFSWGCGGMLLSSPFCRRMPAFASSLSLFAPPSPARTPPNATQINKRRGSRGGPEGVQRGSRGEVSVKCSEPCEPQNPTK